MQNDLVGEYVSEEKLNRIIEVELRQKLKKQKNTIKELDTFLYKFNWKISLYKNGGYGKDLLCYPDNKYSLLTKIYLVRILYFWYSNSIIN